MTVIVAYVPVLHQSYIDFFEKQDFDRLYIVNQEIIDIFPRIKREIRAIDPPVVLQLLSYLPNVELAGINELEKLAKTKGLSVIMPDETISEYLRDTYFSRTKVTLAPFFLRFDEKTVQAARKEVPFNGQISAEEFDREVMTDLKDEKEKSSDWFLRVAAALIIDQKIMDKEHNHRMPTAQSMWAIGDPRNYMEYGSDTHQRTSIHAEQAVIAHAARDGIATAGASIYATTFPCPDCSQVLAEAGIKKVYFVDGYSELSSTEVFKQYEIEIVKVVQNDQKKPEPNQTAQ